MSGNSSLIPVPSPQQFEFGERAVIVLFRGAGNLLGFPAGADVPGIDTLNTRLPDTFQDYFLTSQVFDSFTGNVTDFDEIGSEQGQAFLNQFEEIPALGLVGYSGGGLSAIRLAEGQGSRPVNLLVQLDSYDPLTGTSPADEVLPANVLKGINYYQNANRLNVFEPDFDLLDLQGAREVAGSENLNAEDFFDDPSITHRTIDENPRVQDGVLQDIEEFVLQDLRFDRSNQLILSGGAALTNNILSLTPSLSGEAGSAFLAPSLAVDDDFSFQTQFEFRLDPPSPASFPAGFSFALQAAAEEFSDLAIAFNPQASSTSTVNANAVAVLTPDIAATPLVQAIAPLDLDSGQPLTAWIDYNGISDQLAVFLDDSLVQPSTPLLTYGLDLNAIVGDEVQFGFQTTVSTEERAADLLTWQLQAIADNPTLPSTLPEEYLNLPLTQRAAAAFFEFELPYTPFEVSGLDFSTFFDEAFYLSFNPDVLTAVTQGTFTSGYDHFTETGWLEGRRPSSLYDEAFYVQTNGDVAQAIANDVFSSGLAHFVTVGHVENRDPSTLFSQTDYLTSNPDVAAALTQGTLRSAFEHYVETGAAEGRHPQLLLFQEGYYLTQNPDVQAAVSAGGYSDGLAHYLTIGYREGRNPSALFNEASYLALNPDVAAAIDAGNLASGWAHYLLYGRFEGRTSV